MAYLILFGFVIYGLTLRMDSYVFEVLVQLAKALKTDLNIKQPSGTSVKTRNDSHEWISTVN